jgi:hypothetical protein
MEIDGKPVRLLDSSSIMLDEWAEIFDELGMDPPDFETAIGRVNAKAWRKIMQLSVKRNGPLTDELEAAIGRVPLVDMIVAAQRVNELEAADAVPPASRGGTPKTNPDGSATPPETTETATTSSENDGAPNGSATSDERETLTPDVGRVG